MKIYLAIVLSAMLAIGTATANAQISSWVNVTPSNVDLVHLLDCGNYGSFSIVADPARPSNLYTHFDCQGVWKSVDYGQTWSGPIDTGSGAKGSGGLAIAAGASGQPPILYSVGIRGTGVGFWRSLDGGVTWTNYNVAPGGSRQDFYPPAVDPYNGNHLVMNGHEMNLLVQSVDGGQHWTTVPMASGMNENGGTGFLFFVNTGDAGTTASTWLWTAQGTGGVVGTWRTTNGGDSWTRVDSNEHSHGTMQTYQIGSAVYMAGVYSALGWGILRSTDYGQTWVHVGDSGNAATVFGTPNSIYSMNSCACITPIFSNFQVASQPGAAGWALISTPAGMQQGAAQAAVVYDGSHYVLVTANWVSGLWRYVETASAPPPPPPPPPPPDVCQVVVRLNGTVLYVDTATSMCSGAHP